MRYTMSWGDSPWADARNSKRGSELLHLISSCDRYKLIAVALIRCCSPRRRLTGDCSAEVSRLWGGDPDFKHRISPGPYAIANMAITHTSGRDLRAAGRVSGDRCAGPPVGSAPTRDDPTDGHRRLATTLLYLGHTLRASRFGHRVDQINRSAAVDLYGPSSASLAPPRWLLAKR